MPQGVAQGGEGNGPQRAAVGTWHAPSGSGGAAGLDGLRGRLRCLPQGACGQMGIPLCDRGIRMAKDLLDFIQRSTGIYQGTGMVVAKVMQAYMGQASLLTQSLPDFIDSGHATAAPAAGEEPFRFTFGL